MAEKTEQPTAKKLRDARKEGNLLFSKEIVSATILGFIILNVIVMSDHVADVLYSSVEISIRLSSEPFDVAYGNVLSSVVHFVILGSAMVMVPAVLAIIVANMVQIGVYFSFAKLKKGVQAINFIKNAKQMFSKQSLFAFGMNVVKSAVIGLCVYYIVKTFLYDFVKALACGFSCVNQLFATAFMMLFILVFLIAAILAVIDYIFQRYFFLSNLKMSKDEVKREFKESEGDPEIKSYRRGIHQEILASSMETGIKKATVIVKNPTRYAVALRYENDGDTPLPVVLSKAEGAMALRMIEIAEREGIPVYEDVQLAQGLYHDIETGHYITRNFIAPVAEILHVIEDIKRKERPPI